MPSSWLPPGLPSASSRRQSWWTRPRLELLEENLAPAPGQRPTRETIKGLLRPGPEGEDEEPRPEPRKAREPRKQDAAVRHQDAAALR